MQDKVAVGVVALVLPLLMIAGLSTALHYFVAKREPPHRRAARTVGLAYLITSVALIVVVPWPAALLAPVAAIPAASFMLLYWRSEFRRWQAEALAEAEATPDEDEEWLAEAEELDLDEVDPHMENLTLIAALILLAVLVMMTATRPGGLDFP